MVTQKKWRMTGVILVLTCSAMAVMGPRWHALRESLLVMGVYWGIFLVLMIATIYIVLLDLRYIRMQYAILRREIFRQTLGSEEFQKALRKTRERKSSDKSKLN